MKIFRFLKVKYRGFKLNLKINSAKKKVQQIGNAKEILLNVKNSFKVLSATSKESSASSAVPSAPLLPRSAPRLTNWLLRHTRFYLEPPTPKALLSVCSVSYELRPGSPYER